MWFLKINSIFILRHMKVPQGNGTSSMDRSRTIAKHTAVAHLLNWTKMYVTLKQRCKYRRLSDRKVQDEFTRTVKTATEDLSLLTNVLFWSCFGAISQNLSTKGALRFWYTVVFSTTWHPQLKFWNFEKNHLRLFCQKGDDIMLKVEYSVTGIF